MRLLHWTDRGYALEDVSDPSDYRYAILSHRWYDEGEILYKDILAYPHGHVTGWASSKPQGPDKQSRASLPSAPKERAWQKDVPGECPALNDGSEYQWKHAFANSVWFGRGWLIAPKVVHFFGADWNYLGPMTGLVQTIATCTSIHSKLLSGEYELEAFNMAQRISWMAARVTTRIEDEAYCLLGLLGVNMPLLYGEGQRAFQRLQEEVIRSNDDLSIFAWNAPGAEAVDDSRFSLLAPSPASFTGCEGMWRTRGYHGAYTFQLNNVSLQGTLNVVPITLDDATAKRGNVVERYYVPLNCELGSDFSRVVALTVEMLKRSQWEEDSPYLIVNRASPSPFLPGLDRLSIIHSNHWLAARRRTITLLKKPPLSADGRLMRSDGNYSLKITRTGTAKSPLQVVDIYPRDCVYAPPPATMPWRTAQPLTNKRSVLVQRSRSAVTGVHLKLGYSNFYIVLMVDQHRNDLARSLPMFSGALELHTHELQDLRSQCERHIPTRMVIDLSTEGAVIFSMVKVRLSGSMQAGLPVMMLELSVT